MPEAAVTPAVREAVLHGVAMVQATRSGYRGDIPFEGRPADRPLVPMALAGIAVALLDKIEELGGDPDEELRDISAAIIMAEEACGG
jgi:hypothetical protein